MRNSWAPSSRPAPATLPSRDGFWHAHIALGFLVLAGEAAATCAYALESTHGPSRLTILVIACVVGLLALVGAALAGQITRLSWRNSFITMTSLVCQVVLAVSAHLDRGIESPLLYLSVLPVVYLGLFARPRLVGFAGLASIGTVIAVGMTDHNVDIPQESLLMLVAVVVGLIVLAVAASIHRERLHAQDAKLVAELNRRSVTDELTGCLNFRGFHERFAEEVNRAVRYDHPLCLIVCDVDYLRGFNDQFGHQQGDQALAAVGHHLRSAVRSIDVVGRVGGDEFAILLPNTALTEATRAAHRMMDHAGADAAFPTLSIGVATLGRREPTAKRLFRDADRAMFAAKRDGRARVVASSARLDRLALVRDDLAEADRKRTHDAIRQLQRESVETEMILGMLVQEAAVGIGFIGCDGRVVRMNETLAAINDHDATADLGRSMDALGAELWPSVGSVFEEVLASGEARRNVEISRAEPPVNGAPTAWLANLFPVRVADQLLGVGLVVLDITDRKLLERSAEELTESVTMALAATAEARDPYTAGHQRRVSEIAIAIARELGFDEYDVKGIGLAAAIHDIGKVAIPAEILSRPARLTPEEMQLVRIHAEAGYTILRDIKFPWPVAEMVRQHHERLDGSGYPLGLHADEILPGSRILAVADVIEAMSSHRPYRGALGIEAALDYVQQESGRLFDSDVVAACTSLFDAGQLELSGTAA